MLMKQWIDVRSDTVTQPTTAMRERMMDAEVGDDVYGDDPTVLELEAKAAQLAGKEAGLFVPSGTMGNQIAIMTHTRPGDEIIVSRAAHIITHESGAPARLSGVGYALVDSGDAMIRPEDVTRNIRPDDMLSPPSTLLCLENALSNGKAVPLELMRSTAGAAKARGLAVHLDGARLFNAAFALKVDPKDIAAPVDSVMFCLSKGLCAPVGSMVCGTQDFIRKARKNRKMLGGGMRQVGMMAAAGLVALETMIDRLPDDHANAVFLADLLDAVPGISVIRECLDINMVFWRADVPAFDETAFVKFMLSRGIRCNEAELTGEYRFVTHHDLDRRQLEIVADAVQAYALSLS